MSIVCKYNTTVFFLINKIIKLNIPVFKGPINFTFDGFKLFFLFSFPFFVPYLIGQLNGIVEKAIATSLGVGVVSIIDYSRRIPDLLNSILVSIVLTILVPTLTKAFINNDVKTYNREFLASYRLGLLGLILFIVFFINGAEPVFYLLYKSPAINTVQMNDIILLSKLFSISLIGVFSYIILGMSMLSVNKAKLYVITGVLAQIVVIFFNSITVKWLGMKVFPLSFFLAHFFAAIYMCMHYPYDKAMIYRETIRYYLLCILSAFFAYFIYSLYKFSFGENVVLNLFVEVLYSLLLTLVFVGFFGCILKVPEINMLFKLIKSTLIRGNKT
ncbi:lipid II flippase MurJ [Acinetobacter parvus]|uniref:lipid II flippase MurJ n=1 Tax=Acinetobacter parvus TaxID=134533 RepID=UPI0009E6419B